MKVPFGYYIIIISKNIQRVKLNNNDKRFPLDGDIAETAKSIVMPEHRGHGIYAALHQEIKKHIEKKYGNVHILVATKVGTIKKINRLEGSQEIGFSNYRRIHGDDEKQIMAEEESLQADGRTVFLYRPSQNLDSR